MTPASREQVQDPWSLLRDWIVEDGPIGLDEIVPVKVRVPSMRLRWRAWFPGGRLREAVGGPPAHRHVLDARH